MTMNEKLELQRRERAHSIVKVFPDGESLKGDAWEATKKK